MTLNQRGKRDFPGSGGRTGIKGLTVCGTGLYGGVARDPKDPSKKTVSGKRFNQTALLCAFWFLLCVFLVAVVGRYVYCL